MDPHPLQLTAQALNNQEKGRRIGICDVICTQDHIITTIVVKKSTLKKAHAAQITIDNVGFPNRGGNGNPRELHAKIDP